MRRIVHVRVSTSVERAKPELEDYIGRRVQYAEAFPYAVHEPGVSIREVHALRITPLLPGDYPPLEIVATLRVSLTGRTTTSESGMGPRCLDLDVEVTARGTIRGDGTYDIAPQAARVKAWWPEVFR